MQQKLTNEDVIRLLTANFHYGEWTIVNAPGDGIFTARHATKFKWQENEIVSVLVVELENAVNVWWNGKLLFDLPIPS